VNDTDGWHHGEANGWHNGEANGWHDGEANGSCEDGPDNEDGWRDDELGGSSGAWPLTHNELDAAAGRLWFRRLWFDACALRERYGLALRSGWWRDSIQVEALAALAAWVARYDSGEWDDPPGKLALLFDLERVGALLRDGTEPFNRERDEPLFVEYVLGKWPREAAHGEAGA
jgi:hypothetical protein